MLNTISIFANPIIEKPMTKEQFKREFNNNIFAIFWFEETIIANRNSTKAEIKHAKDIVKRLQKRNQEIDDIYFNNLEWAEPILFKRLVDNQIVKEASLED